MKAAWTVFRKEWIDALRDRRTLLAVLMSSVVMGPLVLVALSVLVAQTEQRAERREIVVQGIEQAPTLRNYLERQTYVIKPAPKDYEQQLRDSHLGDPVVVVPKDFERELAQGESPVVTVVSSSDNQRASGSVTRIEHLLAGFVSERATLRLVSRGVAPALMQVIQVQRFDLASPLARAALFTGILPVFVLLAVAYGALNAALDTTAGERERGSLEPLLMTPAQRAALVGGKWAAVASVGMLIAALSSFSFLPGQWLLRSETLAALFQYGPRDALLFLALLVPFAAALSAVMMAVAIRCKTFKEAQANNTVVMLAVSLLPMVTVFNQEGERPWHLWVPGLAQMTLMNRVLKGEALGAADIGTAALACALVAALAIGFVARQVGRVVAR
jgi:sodium transport system permease protein